jgi:PiT family inorganic phosphate transporter
MLLLAGACLVIYAFSRRHRITHANVTDSHEVLVLAAATPTAYDDDPLLEVPPKPKKVKRPKAKSAA